MQKISKNPEEEEKQFYEDKMLKMLRKVENISTLKYICIVIESYLKSRGI